MLSPLYWGWRVRGVGGCSLDEVGDKEFIHLLKCILSVYVLDMGYDKNACPPEFSLVGRHYK